VERPNQKRLPHGQPFHDDLLWRIRNRFGLPYQARMPCDEFDVVVWPAGLNPLMRQRLVAPANNLPTWSLDVD
jgi:hypothetical protein